MSASHDRPALRPTRRSLIAMLGVAAGAAAVGGRQALAQDETGEATAEATPPIIVSSATGEIPTYGSARTAPVGSEPAQLAAAGSTIPVAISIEAIQVQAQIEQLQIVNGTMENPTGPWVVSWYKETAELGETGNVVLAGHVDYWNVGPAVFYDIRNLAEGDEVILTGEDGSTFTYAVTTNEIYDVNALINGGITEIVAPTETPVLTMITCGGEFDYQNGEYLSRTVVRAELVPTHATPPAE